MRQLHTSQHRSARFARILVLAAMLCVVAVPVVEATHQHGLGDGNAECLLCKTSSLAPVVAASAAINFLVNHTKTQPPLARAPRSQCYQPQQSRGPPRYS